MVQPTTFAEKNKYELLNMRKLLTVIVCATFCISVVQAQNSESMLSMKERQIAAISGSAAKGDKAGLATALTAGLDAGLTVNEIKEVLHDNSTVASQTEILIQRALRNGGRDNITVILCKIE